MEGPKLSFGASPARKSGDRAKGPFPNDALWRIGWSQPLISYCCGRTDPTATEMLVLADIHLRGESGFTGD
jgi:hypothetical protein